VDGGGFEAARRTAHHASGLGDINHELVDSSSATRTTPAT
jgi:hypothetical protein